MRNTKTRAQTWFGIGGTSSVGETRRPLDLWTENEPLILFPLMLLLSISCRPVLPSLLRVATTVFVSGVESALDLPSIASGNIISPGLSLLATPLERPPPTNCCDLIIWFTPTPPQGGVALSLSSYGSASGLCFANFSSSTATSPPCPPPPPSPALESVGDDRGVARTLPSPSRIDTDACSTASGWSRGVTPPQISSSESE